MRRINKPTDDVIEVFSICISNYQDDELRKRLNSCKDFIELATIEFEKKVSRTRTHTIPIHDKVAGKISNKEMCKVYDDKMAKKSGPGRVYYDKFLSAPKNSICPLCGVRQVSTLDHYLPKMKYPSLAVTPSNLIPSCKDCNFTKHDDTFSSAIDETIHPYFDNIENELWLYAQILEDEYPIVSYYAKKPKAWDDILFGRVANHFELFELNRLYATHAAEEISSIRRKLFKLYYHIGVNAVKEQLKEDMESCEAVHLNSWKSALYRALYNSEWFCTEWIKTG